MSVSGHVSRFLSHIRKWHLIVAGCVFFAAVALVAQHFGGNDETGNSTGEQSSSASAPNPTFTYHLVPQETLTLITEPDDGIAPILSTIQTASSSIDIVMYELQDEQVEDALAAAAGRGVAIRVLLNEGYYGKPSSANQAAYAYLESHHVPVKWSPAYFALTHQKTLIIDAHTAIIMTFNLTPKYYKKSRDFGIEDPDPHDIAAIEHAFTADWNHTQAPSESADDLVWSPDSKQLLLGMIASAHTSLLVTSEELTDSDTIQALTDAARRGVQVQVLMTDSKKWHSAFAELTTAGVQIRVYSARAKLYIHEKVIIADGTQAFVGSENLTTSSLQKNRELGLLISTPGLVHKLAEIFATDWNGATPTQGI